MSLKSGVGISLIIFWAAIAAIIMLGSSSGTKSNLIAPTGPLTLDFATVAKHHTPSDCWLIIGGKVYDISKHLATHPGGEGVVIPYCGREATNAFAAKDRGNNHSGFAYASLNSFLLGDVNQTIGTEVLQNVQGQPAPQFFRGREDN